MSGYVIDASVAVKWLVTEDFSREALSLADSGSKLIAPAFIALEVLNSLWAMRRRGRISIEKVRTAVGELRSSPLLLLPITADLSVAALRTALEIDHAVYHCYYLALAVRANLTLITADKQFLNKVRSKPTLANYILHISEVSFELNEDSDGSNTVHEPAALPYVYNSKWQSSELRRQMQLQT